jgi:hypothetical protein
MTNGDFKPALNGLVNSVPVLVGDQQWDVYVLGAIESGDDWLVHTAVVGPDTHTFVIPVSRVVTVRTMARAVLDTVVDRMLAISAVTRAAMPGSV